MTDGGELIANRYRLISQVGRGAMGVVWHAHDERLGRPVAVKQLRAPIGMSSTQIEQSQQRARREARIAARLQHPNAVGIYDVVEHDGRPCLVMEYVPSRTLSAVMAEDDGSLTEESVAVMGAQLASALAAAHEAGIVHRDIKPGNILIPESGPVKLTDFGISRATGDVTLTGTGEILGTPAFTTPEVAQGRTAGDASDVFSLGATLYAAVEGEPPFGTGPNVVALLLRIVNDEITPPRHSGALMNTLMWMMRHDPAERPSMRQAVRELESAALAAAPASVGAAAEASPAGDVGVNEPGEADDAVAGHEPVEQQTGESGPSSPTVPVGAQNAAEDRPQRASRRSRPPMRIVALLGVAAVLTAGIVAAVTASGGSSGSNTAAPPPRTSPAGTSSKAAAPPSSHGAATTSSSAPAATSSAGTASQLASTISKYYQLVPDDLNQAWGYMTADYQQNHAGGLTGYREFWDKVQSVSITDLVVDPPSTVVVTIDYRYKNGSTEQDRTSIGLVKQNGSWVIATSSVLGTS